MPKKELDIREFYVIFRKEVHPYPPAVVEGKRMLYATLPCPKCGQACWRNAARDIGKYNIEVMCDGCVVDFIKAHGPDEVRFLDGAELDKYHA